uniref:RE66231p n=1 Tax=Drosophila melanogaster TaxID=7227 RepID=D3DN20_DROME|nr:RE66231p [Drosophila melanogaster]
MQIESLLQYILSYTRQDGKIQKTFNPVRNINKSKTKNI